MVQDNNKQNDADGYYGDDDMDEEELDLSFLDQDDAENASDKK